MHKTPQT